MATRNTSGTRNTASGRNASGSRNASPSFRNEVGLVAYWTMNDNAANTTVIDTVIGGNNGTFSDATGNPNTSAHTVAGQVGTALNFDGVDDFINAGDTASLNITTVITLETWVYSDWKPWLSGYDFAHLINKGKYFLYAYAGVLFQITDGGITYEASSAALSANTWLHVVGVYDGSNLKVYVNGVQSGDATAHTGDIDSSSGTALRIGVDVPEARYFEGKMDEVRIYNRALTAEEVKQRYNGTK